MSAKRQTLAATDGYPLGANVFSPAQAPSATVLIHPATAVPQRWYEGFAEYLSGQGFEVVTYDYRGIGYSRPARLPGFEATMSRWAFADVEGVTEWARQRHPQRPLLAIGHSFGGHAIGLCDSSRHLRAAALVASHAGSTRLIATRRERWRVRLMLRVVMPLSNHLFGYVAGKRLGLGEDLPKQVANQWSGWTTLPHYFFDDPTLQAADRFRNVAIPLAVLGFDDAPWATAPAIDLMMAYFQHARIERYSISAATLGSGPIGHLGYFKRKHQASLWPQLAAWLRRQAEASPSGADPAAAAS